MIAMLAPFEDDMYGAPVGALDCHVESADTEHLSDSSDRVSPSVEPASTVPEGSRLVAC